MFCLSVSSSHKTLPFWPGLPGSTATKSVSFIYHRFLFSGLSAMPKWSALRVASNDFLLQELENVIGTLDSKDEWRRVCVHWEKRTFFECRGWKFTGATSGRSHDLQGRGGNDLFSCLTLPSQVPTLWLSFPITFPFASGARYKKAKETTVSGLLCLPGKCVWWDFNMENPVGGRKFGHERLRLTFGENLFSSLYRGRWKMWLNQESFF